MTTTFTAEGDALVIRFGGETIRIEPWGENALRVRAAQGARVAEPHVSALLDKPVTAPPEIALGAQKSTIRQGRLIAEARLQVRYGADVPKEPVIRFLDAETGEELLSETRPHFAGPAPRHYKTIAANSFQLEATFKAHDGERLWGLGQPQHGQIDLKGTTNTLVQQNTVVVVPFVVSSRGYGFLWNNPAAGRAEFARNLTRWTAQATPGLDYWVTAGPTPRDVVRAYVTATGRPPMLPDWAAGFWQCKLRYRTQEELLSVARDYKARGLPLSCIVIDFFAWTRQGEWQFDPKDWPDPEGLVAELDAMGIETMVSIWPTVAANSDHYQKMRDEGMLLRTERGVPVVIQFPDKDPYGIHFLTYYDPFNPEAREFHWQLVRDNYVKRGIRNFWLDACEPEMRPAHPEHVRTHLGNGAEMLSAFPRLHAERYAQGLAEEGVNGVLLARSTWAGGQRGPVILWSGDVWSNWEDYRAQVAAGVHAGMSGIGWWTQDIGGFYDGHAQDPSFRELLVRWFEFGVFTPICRLHGVRIPEDVPVAGQGEQPSYGRELFRVFTDTGGANEVWSYGAAVEEKLVPLLHLRERLRPYIMEQMRAYHETGDPVMRPLSYDFPDDPQAAAESHAYLFGPDILVAPMLREGATEREVWLPQGADWVHPFTGAAHRGGQRVTIPAPLGQPPVMVRKGREALVALVRGAAAP